MNPVANEVDAVRAELAASRRAWEEADENLWAAANRMTFERSVPAEKVTELYKVRSDAVRSGADERATDAPNGMVRRLLLSIAFGLALGYGLIHLPAKYAVLAALLLIAGGMAQAFLFILNLHWILRQHRRFGNGLPCETKPWYVEWNSFLDRHSGKL